MDLQGFEVYVTKEETKVGPVVDQLGRRQARATLPADTLLIPNRQPEAHLVAALLEFDGRMSREYLERERRAILRDGQTTIYDTTAWNLTMLYGLEALTVESALPAGIERYAANAHESPAVAPGELPAVAWMVDGADDASVALAARLLESGLQVRVSDRAVELGDASLARGSVVVLPADNRSFAGDLGSAVRSVAAELELSAIAATTGYGDGDLPDLGGGHFRLLQAPRIALVGRDGVNSYDFGSMWYILDHRLGIRHTHLEGGSLRQADLRRYNVIVLPDRAWSVLDEPARSALRSWVEAGGTLVAVARSARDIASEAGGLSGVRQLGDVLGDLDAYETAVLREHLERQKALPSDDEVWSHLAMPGSHPWNDFSELTREGAAELERRDAWDRLFMPQGAFVAARVDAEHWLTSGVGPELPVLVSGSTVLMTQQPVEAPVRLGVLEPQADAPARRVGWSAVPAGMDLRLRISGLLWPEAAGRLANSAALTRERRGMGQIILFANPPTFRATSHGTTRLFLNAVVYGPGCGASAPIMPW